MISKELPLQMIEITSQLESESGLSEEKESKYALQIKSEQSRWFHPQTLSQSKLGRHQSAITVDQVRNLLYVSESELFISNFSICNFLQVCQFLGLRDYPLPQLPVAVTKNQEEFERFHNNNSLETRNPSLGTNKKLPNFRYLLPLAASVNPGAGYLRLATLARAKWAQVGGI